MTRSEPGTHRHGALLSLVFRLCAAIAILAAILLAFATLAGGR